MLGGLHLRMQRRAPCCSGGPHRTAGAGGRAVRSLIGWLFRSGWFIPLRKNKRLKRCKGINSLSNTMYKVLLIGTR